MERGSKFSYVCNRCGLCCRDKVITLSPYDVIRIARAVKVTTGTVVARYTMRRGSLLRFLPDGRCAALDGPRCTIHSGRPLACRLYPLGLNARPALTAPDASSASCNWNLPPRRSGSMESPARSRNFSTARASIAYLDAVAFYYPLVGIFRERVAATVDFERVEPHEFWRRAAREALAEANYDQIG